MAEEGSRLVPLSRSSSLFSLAAGRCEPQFEAGCGTVKRDPQPFTSGSSITHQAGLAGLPCTGDCNGMRTASIPRAVIAPALPPVLI